jgi:hypothetical protein
MRRSFLIILMMGLVSWVEGQKSDYNWLSGYDSNVVLDSAQYQANGFWYGISQLNFNFPIVDIVHDSLGMNFDETNLSYSDSSGNIFFYSNGIYIANHLDQMIENSDSLNAGYLEDVWDPSIELDGYRLPQAILALQSESNNSQYYIIHSFYDTVPGSQATNFYGARILVTLLDMSANSGHGKVIYKNSPLIVDSIGTEIAAVRHGNGRDWWILIQRRNTNCFFRILVDSNGPQLMQDLTCLGTVMDIGQIGAACFSPDGSKYVYLGGYTGINIYDFDRCLGTLSNPQYMPLPVIVDSGWLGMGVAISPNNQFLYVSLTKQLYQFDLSAPNPFSTIDTVGIYDGFKLPFGSYFNTEQIGPDGKIYISCGNAEADYHIINNPDGQDTSCNFIQHGLRLLTPSGGVPYFPNYRLGASVGSACDTITGLNEVQRALKEQILKVFPNPANDVTTVDYGFTDWNKGPVSLEITNALGQPIYTQPLPLYSGYQKLDISHYSPGTYTVFIKRNNAVVAANKLVVVR